MTSTGEGAGAPPAPALVLCDPTVPEVHRSERFCEMYRGIEMPELRGRFLAPIAALLATADPAGEQALRALLYVGTTWELPLLRVRGLPSLRRLALQAAAGVVVSPEAMELVQSSAARGGVDQLADALQTQLARGSFPSGIALEGISFEARALQERTRGLADRADPYSMRTMARLLPRLRICDELSERLLLLVREALDGTQTAPDLGLRKFLGEKEFGKFLAQCDATPDLAALRNILHCQAAWQLDPPVMSALMTISRSLGLPRPGAPWKERAAFWFDPRLASPAWTVPATAQASVLRLLARAGVEVAPGRCTVRAADLVLPELLDAETASVDLTAGKRPQPPDWKALIMSNITRETLLVGFLNNPKVVRVPGLVECVVNNARSSQVLSMIATKRDLHTGHQNKGVPAALLRSRVKVPLTLLRRFMHLRFVSRVELKDLAQRAPRQEVAKEIAAYLASI